jgi:hypothetical protein
LGAKPLAPLVVTVVAVVTTAFAQGVERPDVAPPRVERANADRHRPVSGEEISQRDIAAALEVVRNDPNLSAERKTRTLRWVEGGSLPDSRKPPEWLKWVADLFVWLAQNGRFLFWGVLVVLAAMLIIYLVRLASGWRIPERSRPFKVPSFVLNLDIRPESLPDDIGASARQLWEAGDHRAALSLLYRGLLSRLAHVHGVPIKDSTTEGDCLSLASSHLFDDARKVYVVKLIRLWQRAVYGGEQVEAESVYELCDRFARALNDPEAAPTPGAQASARRVS